MMGLSRGQIIGCLTRSSDAPCFQADLDSLSGSQARGAAVVFNPLRLDVLLLQVWRSAFWYTETGSGEAVLSLPGRSLPETVCAAVVEQGLGIGDVIEAEASTFYVHENSRVTSIVNHVAGSQQALTIEMTLAFEVANWGLVDRLSAGSFERPIQIRGLS
jgi:hypothetical protein